MGLSFAIASVNRDMVISGRGSIDNEKTESDSRNTILMTINECHKFMAKIIMANEI